MVCRIHKFISNSFVFSFEGFISDTTMSCPNGFFSYGGSLWLTRFRSTLKTLAKVFLKLPRYKISFLTGCQFIIVYTSISCPVGVYQYHVIKSMSISKMKPVWQLPSYILNELRDPKKGMSITCTVVLLHCLIKNSICCQIFAILECL